MTVAAVPLIFDYVSTNRLGALSCGMGIVFGFVSFLQANSMGAWIAYSSRGLSTAFPKASTNNYMAGYHHLFGMGLLGLGYLLYFAHLDRTGYIQRRPKTATDAPPGAIEDGT